MDRKAQSAMEVMIIIGIVLVISSIVLFSLNDRNLTVERTRQFLDAQKETDKVADAIGLAALGGRDFVTNITVSAKAADVDADSFQVLGNGRKVEMRWQGPRNETLVVSTRLFTSNVEDATLRTALIQINNTGATIEVRCWNDAQTTVAVC